MTERRDTARIGSVDPSPLGMGDPEPMRPGLRRFGRLVPLPTARRLAISKIGPAGAIAAVVLGLLVVGGASLSQHLVAWLHNQKIYRLGFQEIELIPEPPSWLKPGRLGLLEQVRGDRDQLKSFSMADLDLGKLMIDFRRNPWIERVDRATRAFPNRVAVHLAYFEPVAIVRSDRTKTDGPKYAVNRAAIVLPLEDIDDDHAATLIDVVAAKPRETPRPGVEWPEGPDDASAKDYGGRVANAAKLAAFFREQIAARNAGSMAFEPRSIVVDWKDAIWVKMDDQSLVLWGYYPALSNAAEPSDAQKWAWLEARGRDGWNLKHPEFLGFDRDGVRLQVGKE